MPGGTSGFVLATYLPCRLSSRHMTTPVLNTKHEWNTQFYYTKVILLFYINVVRQKLLSIVVVLLAPIKITNTTHRELAGHGKT